MSYPAASDDEVRRNERIMEVRLSRWMEVGELCCKAATAQRLSDRMEITHTIVSLLSPEEREEIGVKIDRERFVAILTTVQMCEAGRRLGSDMRKTLLEIEEEFDEILRRVWEGFVEKQKLLRHIKDLADASSI